MDPIWSRFTFKIISLFRRKNGIRRKNQGKKWDPSPKRMGSNGIRYVFQGKNGIRAVYLHFAVFQRQEEKTFGPLMRKNAHFSFPAFNKMRVDSTMLVVLVWSPEPRGQTKFGALALRKCSSRPPAGHGVDAHCLVAHTGCSFAVLRACAVAGCPINDFTKGCFGYPAM